MTGTLITGCCPLRWASKLLAKSGLSTKQPLHFPLAPFQGWRHIPRWARNGRAPSRCGRVFWYMQSEVSPLLPTSAFSARACACAERGARGGWAVGCSALGSAASPQAVGSEPRAAVSSRIRAGASEPGGIARSGQAHGRLSGTPPPPQPPPPPPPPPPQPAAARAQQPWPKTTGTGACGEQEEKEVARPHPGPPPQAPPRRPRGAEVARAPPPVSASARRGVGAALPLAEPTQTPGGAQGSGLHSWHVPPPPANFPECTGARVIRGLPDLGPALGPVWELGMGSPVGANGEQGDQKTKRCGSGW